MRGEVVIGMVSGNVHDIGKSLVATLLKVNGFEVTDLGADVEPGKFVRARKEIGADSGSILLVKLIGSLYLRREG